MKTIKIKYGIDPPTYVYVTEAEVMRAFSSAENFKNFINKVKEEGEKHARQISSDN